MKKFNIKEPDKCDNCHNKILREFYDTEYNGVKQPRNVCPNCFKKGNVIILYIIKILMDSGIGWIRSLYVINTICARKQTLT